MSAEGYIIAEPIRPDREVITEPIEAIRRAGRALEHLIAIRNSTLPGTALWDTAERAIAETYAVVGVLYGQGEGWPC